MREIDILAVRVQKLERDSRHLRIVLGIFFGAVLAGLLAYLIGGPNPPLQSRAFELIDSQGQLRARLGIESEAVGLHLMDPEGRPRVSVIQDTEQGALLIRDSEGQIRVGSSFFAHGGAGFALHGPQGAGTAVLYLKDGASLRFIDSRGREYYRIPE